MRRMPLIILLALVMGLTACSKQAPEVSTNQQVPAAQATAEVHDEEGGEAPVEASFEDAAGVWVGDQLSYTSAPDTLPAGEVVLGLEVIGGLPHNVVFEGIRGDQPLVDGPGEGQFASVVTLEPGTYTYYCSIVGHRAAGMEGTVVVE